MPTVMVGQDSIGNLRLSSPDIGFRIPIKASQQLTFKAEGIAFVDQTVTLGCEASKYLRVESQDSATCVVGFQPNIALPPGNTLCDVTINLPVPSGTSPTCLGAAPMGGVDPTIVIDNP